MNFEQWKSRYAHLLDEVPITAFYSDEANSKDYKRLSSHFDQDDLGGKHGAKAFFSRPQIRREGLPKVVSRTIPEWMHNREAVHSLLLAQFPILGQHRYFYSAGRSDEPREPVPMLCPCSKCRRAMQGALEWDFVIRLVRMNRPAQEIADEWNNAFIVDFSLPECWEGLKEDKPKPDKILRYGRKKLTAASVRRTIQRIREVTAK